MGAQEQYILVNVNEEIVKEQASDLMPKSDMCHCEKCFKDVCAIALNKIPGHYVTSRKGETMANVIKTVMENRVEVVVAVSKAIETVKDNPSH